MAKKRKSVREFKKHRKTQRFRTKKTDERDTSLKNLVLSVLYSNSSPLSQEQIANEVSRENKRKKNDLTAVLNGLIHAGLIHKDNKNQFRLQKNSQLYEGILIQHPKGFGFVNVTKSPRNGSQLKRDPFISPTQMAGAHHGDTVLIRVSRVRNDDRPEGSVVRVLFHGTNIIGGTYVQKGHEHLVYPDDRRFPFTIILSNTGDFKVKHGDGVLAQFERSQNPTRFLSGKIIEALGPITDIDTQMRLVIQQFQLPHLFSDKVNREIEMLDEKFDTASLREDLRSTDHVTIDGETAKDFDDAVCVIKTRKGYRLFVSIADVSHFVKPGSAIDQEAYARGTSIYFPGRVIPMLPEKLSNELCSLVPNQDRFTVSAILDFDRSGALVSKRFCRSMICSKQRFTYTLVGKILIDKDPAIRKKYKPFLTGLKWAEELATLLQIRRKERGSIDFNIPEPEFDLTSTGAIASIHIAERNFAHQLIEEFMLAANEAVAEFFTSKKIPAIFRVHEPPESLKAEEFFNFAKTLGFPLAAFANKPAWFAAILEQSKDTQYQYIINNLLLRSMKQAQYSDKNVGHFGLASSDYTHFTSPIRRYPDLIVHRILLRLLEEKTAPRGERSKPPSQKQAGEFLSARERTAIMAEREMNERLKIGYMKDRIGESFDAIISGVTENALYVEIQNLCISGAIPVESLVDDYYLFDKKNYRLFGEITAKTLQLGDPVRVTVVNVDLFDKKIQFTLTSSSPG